MGKEGEEGREGDPKETTEREQTVVKEGRGKGRGAACVACVKGVMTE